MSLLDVTCLTCMWKAAVRKYDMKWLFLFVIQEVILEWTNTTLFPFFLGLFWSCLNYNVIFKYDFHKVHMYATRTIVVMEAGGECMCSTTNAFESQGKYIHEQTIDNE